MVTTGFDADVDATLGADDDEEEEEDAEELRDDLVSCPSELSLVASSTSIFRKRAGALFEAISERRGVVVNAGIPSVYAPKTMPHLLQEGVNSAIGIKNYNGKCATGRNAVGFELKLRSLYCEEISSILTR